MFALLEVGAVAHDLVRYLYVELARGSSWEAVRALIQPDPLFTGESTQIFLMDGLTALAAQERQGMLLNRNKSLR